MMNNIKLGKWRSGDKIPEKSGWYFRDYRNPPKTTEGKLPPYSVDYFSNDEYGKYWFVVDLEHTAFSMNDAWFDKLPWCKIKDSE